MIYVTSTRRRRRARGQPDNHKVALRFSANYAHEGIFPSPLGSTRRRARGRHPNVTIRIDQQ